MLTLGRYYDIYDLELANRQSGRHFFSDGAKRFFNSRIGSNVFVGADGWYFVTSERFDDLSDRLYTVRVMRPDGDVVTVGEFQQYASSSGANRAAERLAAQSLKGV